LIGRYGRGALGHTVVPYEISLKQFNASSVLFIVPSSEMAQVRANAFEEFVAMQTVRAVSIPFNGAQDPQPGKLGDLRWRDREHCGQSLGADYRFS
jgi:hypothetical protein